jgi:uncharacterized protein YqgC (DUF456 family)
MDALVYVLAALMVAVGIAGTVLPAVPGVPLVFAGMLLAAWVDSFRIVGPWTVVVLGAITLLSLAIEYVAAALGVRRVGASGWAMVGAVLGALVGVAAGPVGMLIGPLVGAVAGEWLARRDLRQAGRAGVAAWLGFLVGTVAKAALVVVMLVVFAIAWVA